jgi:hypothetical protein
LLPANGWPAQGSTKTAKQRLITFQVENVALTRLTTMITTLVVHKGTMVHE